MKHFSILVVLLTACVSAFAYTGQTQGNWRWRNSDGSETSATWKANQNTSITIYNNNEVLRLRVVVFTTCHDNGDLPGPCTGSIAQVDSLQYTTTVFGSTPWKNIGDDVNSAFVMAASDNYVQQDQSTTSQLSGSSSPFTTFRAGRIMVSDSVIENFALSKKNVRTEFEWVIKASSDLSPNTTYYFRQRGSTSLYSTAAGYPSLTTGSILPIKLTNFTVNNEGKKVKLEWSTASEANNDYFNIQRSTDGRTWEIINKVKGKGNSSVTTNYSVYDYGPPLTGTVYYRLQQYDKDGQYSFSDVQSVKMFSANRAVVTVLPNPAKSDINFKLENTTTKNVQAILTDVNGRILHEQAFKNVQANNLNRLSLKQQPAPGIYILKLKGDGLLESIKVVVQ